MIRGKQPKHSAERLDLAQRAYDTKRYSLAARLWGEAIETDPSRADDRQSYYRDNTACAAALAANQAIQASGGRQPPDAPPDESPADPGGAGSGG